MKIFNLARGQGKTMRMLYASEFNNVPILCCTDSQKTYLINQTKSLKINIPDPISVSDIICNRTRGKHFNKVLVDEMDDVLREILRFTVNADMIGGTITIEEGEM